MLASVRRVGWWAVIVVEAALVFASASYVGFGTWKFWLVAAAAVLGLVGYWVTVWATPEPTLGDAGTAREHWYWF